MGPPSEDGGYSVQRLYSLYHTLGFNGAAV